MSALPQAVDGLGARLLRNLSMLSVSQGVGLAISVVSVPILSRALSVDEFGAFTYAYAVLALVLTCADPGISTSLVRDLAQAPDQGSTIVQKALGLRLVLAVTASGLAALWCWATLAPTARTATILLLLVVPVQACAVGLTLLQAHVMVRRGVVVELVNRLTGFAALIAALAVGWGLAGAIGGMVLGELAGMLAVVALTWHLVVPRPRCDPAYWRMLLRGSLTVGGAAVLATLVNRVDFLMLEHMVGMESVGYYGAAYRLPMLFERLPALVMATIFPLMSRLAVDDRAALRQVYRWTLLRAALVVTPLVAIVWVTAPWILTWWTQPEFLPGAPALRWLMLATGCIYLAVVAGHILIAIRQTRVSLAIWLCAAPMNIALNLWGIPRYGATGAAAATFATYLVVLVLSAVAVERYLPREPA